MSPFYTDTSHTGLQTPCFKLTTFLTPLSHTATFWGYSGYGFNRNFAILHSLTVLELEVWSQRVGRVGSFSLRGSEGESVPCFSLQRHLFQIRSHSEVLRGRALGSPRPGVLATWPKECRWPLPVLEATERTEEPAPIPELRESLPCSPTWPWTRDGGR